MAYLLDSNHVTYLLQGVARVETIYLQVIHSGDELILSAAVIYEILRGLRESAADSNERRQAEANQRQLVRGWRRASIGMNAANHASTVWTERRKRGQMRPDDGDALIIGQAASLKAILVTADAASAADARRLGLAVENWF